MLGSKSGLRDHAERFGLLEHLPAYFMDASTAQYPCVLKNATGVYGKDCHIVRSASEVDAILQGKSIGEEWVMQEMMPGRYEYSTSLLVVEGEIVWDACTRYEYDRDEYVWPHVTEHEDKRSFPPTPPAHLAAMTAFLACEGWRYSGFCNFNYKLRADDSMAIFEINSRIGADFACDIPRPRARAALEMLDAMFPNGN